MNILAAVMPKYSSHWFAHIRVEAFGCILVGERSERQGTPTLYSSKATEEALTKELIKAQNNHEEIYIEVTDTERYAIERMSEPASYEYRHG